jgi:CPA1 family monovalent cation:H+ antiporter
VAQNPSGATIGTYETRVAGATENLYEGPVGAAIFCQVCKFGQHTYIGRAMLDRIEVILGMLVAVAALALLSRRIPIPYPILLVLGGLGIALVPGLPRIRLNPDLVFVFLLPPLLYPAAIFTPWRDFHSNLRPILLLAVGLVLFTTVAVGYLAHYLLPDFPLAAGFALGAIISPPDAIAATAIAEHLRIPRRIITIIEGESLVNDATALVAFRFAIAALVTGSFSLSHAAGRFLLVALGGIAVGLAVGWLSFRILKPIEDPPIEITISLLTPFAAYLPAEQLQVSGVLAVVTTGLYHGWRIPEFTSFRTRLQGGPVWRMVEFLLNGFIFLLIGLQLPEVLKRLSGQSISQLILYASVISAAVIIIRILWVFPATYLPRFFSKSLRQRDPYPAWQHVTIVAWTGMRGVVSLAAALALPLTLSGGAAFPGRDTILFLTFTVILVTLVVQGLTLPALIRWLKVEDDRSEEREERIARIKANEAALGRLMDLAANEQIDEAVLDRLRAEYEDRIAQLKEEGDGTGKSRGAMFSSAYERLSREALKQERRTILELRNERVINDEVLRRIQRDLDFAETRLSRARD